MERYWHDERGNIFEAGAVEYYAPGTNRLMSDERCEYAYDGNGNMTLKERWSGAERVRHEFAEFVERIKYEKHRNVSVFMFGDMFQQ